MEIYNHKGVQEKLVKSDPDKFLRDYALCIRAAFEADQIGLRGKGSSRQSESDFLRIVKMLSQKK